jgi:hypothetical protein
LLEGPPHRLEEGTKVLPKISGLLGNVGNNQWTNPKGLAHTGFRLGLVETIDLQTRNALLLNGTFLQPEDKKSITEYCGIFVDVPNKLEIEQVYLQVPSTVGVLQFEKYKKTFMTLLRSVCWS